METYWWSTERKRLAHNAIVVAIVDGEPTVKRLHWQNSDFQLQPENPVYPLIRISAEQDLQIWGGYRCCSQALNLGHIK